MDLNGVFKVHTVMPDIVGSGLSFAAPRIELLKDRIHGVAGWFWNRGVLDIGVMMVFRVIACAPCGCLLVIWVACRHRRRPHNLSSPFLGSQMITGCWIWAAGWRRSRLCFMGITITIHYAWFWLVRLEKDDFFFSFFLFLVLSALDMYDLIYIYSR